MSEPVTIAGGVTAAVAAILGALVALGVLDLTAEQTGALVGAVSAIVALVTAFLARHQVTPLSNPRDNTGRRLVPESRGMHVEPVNPERP